MSHSKLARGTILTVSLCIVWKYIVVPAMESDIAFRETKKCEKNVKLISKALLLYAEDWDTHLPKTGDWKQQTETYDKTISSSTYTCPSGDRRNSYAVNANLFGKNLFEIEHIDNRVLVFETDSNSPNAKGSRNDLPNIPRHNGRDVYGIVTGNTKVIGRSNNLDW